MVDLKRQIDLCEAVQEIKEDDETFKSLLFWKAKQCMFLFHSSSPD